MKKTHPEANPSRLGRDFLDRSDPLAQILDLADDAIISVDRGQFILLFNCGAEKMFNYAAREVIGKQLDILLPTRLSSVNRAHVEAFDSSGVPARRMGERQEILARRKDGTEFPAEASISKIEQLGEPVFTVILRDITAHIQAEERLRASLREKEVLIDEIHHRVKNNLQVITSLLGLQSRSIRDASTRKKFQESQYRIQSMAILHEILFQSGNQAHVDFAEYLRRLAGHLFRSYGVTSKVRLGLSLDPVTLHVDAAVPCGLIVNELLSNSFKYAFPGVPGEVRIRLSQLPGQTLCLQVSDTGVGLPPELDWETAPSLGLRLVRTLAKQLEAAVEVDRRHGTTFSFTFGSLASGSKTQGSRAQ